MGVIDWGRARQDLWKQADTDPGRLLLELYQYVVTAGAGGVAARLHANRTILLAAINEIIRLRFEVSKKDVKIGAQKAAIGDLGRTLDSLRAEVHRLNVERDEFRNGDFGAALEAQRTKFEQRLAGVQPVDLLPAQRRNVRQAAGTVRLSGSGEFSPSSEKSSVGVSPAGTAPGLSEARSSTAPLQAPPDCGAVDV